MDNRGKTHARRGDLIAFQSVAGSNKWHIGTVWFAINGYADAAHHWVDPDTRVLWSVSGPRWVAAARDHRDLKMTDIARAFAGRQFKTIEAAHKALVKHVRNVRMEGR